jgi:hypothetical protein
MQKNNIDINYVLEFQEKSIGTIDEKAVVGAMS